MQRLFALIRLFREYLVLVLLSALSIVLIANSNGAPVQTLRTAALSFIATFQSATSWLSGLFTAQYENASLRELNYRLMEEVMQLRRNRNENAELRGMLEMRERSRYRLIPADVINKAVTLIHNTITLDAGTHEGIEPRMPVITEEGLVGKVIAASEHYAIVQMAINRDFRVTARVLRSRIDGIVSWNDGDHLLLKNIWKTADVLVGDTVVTSEYSNAFPPDIPIGAVASIGPDPSGMFSKIQVRPFVSFLTVGRVFVIRAAPVAERDSLEQRHAGN